MSDRIQRRVLHDRALLLDIDARLEPSLAGWLPSEPAGEPSAALPDVRVFAHHAPPLGVEAPTGSPSLRWGSVALWHRAERAWCSLSTDERDVAGMLDLEIRQATIVTAGGEAAAPRLRMAMTMATAVLLGRIGRALVRSSAVLSPSGWAWLLVGPEGSGSVSAAVRLAAAGWRCLGVHEAVVRESPLGAGIEVEAWSCAEAASDEGPAVAPGPHPLAGALIVRTAAEEPTAIAAVAPTDLLGLVGPGAPWLWFDPAAACGTVRALHAGLEVPVRELRLGLDSYANPGRLAEVLLPLR